MDMRYIYLSNIGEYFFEPKENGKSLWNESSTQPMDGEAIQNLARKAYFPRGRGQVRRDDENFMTSTSQLSRGASAECLSAALMRPEIGQQLNNPH